MSIEKEKWCIGDISINKYIIENKEGKFEISTVPKNNGTETVTDAQKISHGIYMPLDLDTGLNILMNAVMEEEEIE